MPSYNVHFANKSNNNTISLPTSKSISNRMLIINALSGNKMNLQNLSESDDTQLMIEGLKNNGGEINIGHAGTAMRFLTAYLCTTGTETVITGSERMKNRPIAKLVEALVQLGADIAYLEKQGYPPLKIGNTIPGNNAVEIDGGISSQYITALLLIAPYLKNGMRLKIKNTLVSRAYIEMTLGLMKQAGINYTWSDSIITIEPQNYRGGDFFVEADWSGASYWYQICSFAANSQFQIKGLQKNSFQGDADLVNIFRLLGIETEFITGGIIIRNAKKPIEKFEYNFLNSPDLIQTVVVTCCFKGIPFVINGAETLRIKETDRIKALQDELVKFGFIITEPVKGTLAWNGQRNMPTYPTPISIETYDDHRMAMAFAPIGVFEQVNIKDPMVVTKSYPTFWEHLTQVGFGVDKTQ